MPRYIDAEEITYDVKMYGWQKILWATKEVVDTVPDADVELKRHGHWVPKKEMIRSPEAKNYNCSVCGKESFTYPNCPFCRSVMDEDVGI